MSRNYKYVGLCFVLWFHTIINNYKLLYCKIYTVLVYGQIYLLLENYKNRISKFYLELEKHSKLLEICRLYFY